MLYLPSRQRMLVLALNTAFGAAFGTALLSHPTLAVAQTQAATQTFDITIAAQPLASALNEVSRQAGIQVLAATELTAGIQAPAVAGRMTGEQALKAVLAGSPLQASRSAGGAFIVERGEKAAATPEAPALPVVTVNAASQETATSHITGVAARRSATATKTDTPLIETPQSISVVGAKEVETIKAQNLMDALGYVAGVARVEGADRTTETLLIRGFQVWAENGSLYRDGTSYSVNVNNGAQEPYGLERIEVLKGAAAVLYGAGSPGGIINTVSKRPTSETLREVNVEAGSFHRKQVSGDFAGAADDAAAWTYRFTFLARDSDTFVNHIPDDRTYLAPALKWQPSAATSITLLSEFQRDRTVYIAALPVEGTVQPNVNGRIPIDNFLGEPGFDKYDNKRGSIGYLFEHAFSDQLKLRNSLRTFKQFNTRQFIYGDALAADQRNITRAAVLAEDDSMAVTSDTSLEYKWKTGSIAHTLLSGLDYSYQKHGQTLNIASVGDLDLFAPTYGAPVGEFTYYGKRELRNRKLGLYVQDQMKIDDKLVLLLGGRQEWSKNDSRSMAVPPSDWVNEESDAFTGRAGLVYLAPNGLAPFLSYSQSFEPTAGKDSITGSRLKPTRSDQYEIGIRYQPNNADLMLTATAYELTKVNIVVSAPITGDVRQIGIARSRGYELEARARMGASTNLAAAYAYTEAVSKDPLKSPEFSRMGGAPLNQFSLWLDHAFRLGDLPGLKVGAGLRYVDKTIASDMQDVSVPSFTLLDAMVSYATGPWRFALNATNLADKRYVASCTWNCYYGEPRKVIGTVTYRW